MKKIKIKEVIGYFPLTVQTAKTVDRAIPVPQAKLPAKNYQSDDVNTQHFHKPISKIISFQ